MRNARTAACSFEHGILNGFPSPGKSSSANVAAYLELPKPLAAEGTKGVVSITRIPALRWDFSTILPEGRVSETLGRVSSC